MINIRSNIENVFRKIMLISVRKKIFITLTFVILLFLIIFVILSLSDNKNNNLTNKEEVKLNNTSRISTSTNKLLIKEWGIEAPVNGNILGNVTYIISSDNTKVNFISSKLNSVDLSSAECIKAGVTKDAWGVRRSAKKASYALNEHPSIIGNFDYRGISPPDICKGVEDIASAYNYLLLYLSEAK